MKKTAKAAMMKGGKSSKTSEPVNEISKPTKSVSTKTKSKAKGKK
jgi:hypothetical protein